MKNGMIQLSQWNSFWYLQAEYLLEVFLFGIRITCRNQTSTILMWNRVPDIISISGLLWRDNCNPSVFGCSLSFYLVPTLIGMLSFKSRFLDSLLMSLLVFWISFSLFIEMNDFFQWRPRPLLIFTIWLGLMWKILIFHSLSKKDIISSYAYIFQDLNSYSLS